MQRLGPMFSPRQPVGPKAGLLQYNAIQITLIRRGNIHLGKVTRLQFPIRLHKYQAIHFGSLSGAAGDNERWGVPLDPINPVLYKEASEPILNYI